MNWLDQVLGGPQGDLAGMDTLEPEFSRIERQRKMIDMLRKTGQNLGGPGGMVGGGGGGGKWQPRPQIYVPENSAGTALAQAGMGYMANRGDAALDRQENAAMQDKQRRMQEWVAQYNPNSGGAQPTPPAQTSPPPGTNSVQQQHDISTPGASPLGKSVAASSGDSDLLKAADAQIARNQQLLGNGPMTPYTDAELRQVEGTAIPSGYKKAVGMDMAAQWANEDADYLNNQLAMDPGNIPRGGVFDEVTASAESAGELTPGQIATPGDIQAVDVPSAPATAPLSVPSDTAAMASEAGAPSALPRTVAGMSDDDKLKWLLRGSIQGIPAANLMINQAGNNLLTGEQRREAAMEILQAKGQQQMELAAAKAEAAMANARTKAEQAAVQRQWQAEQNQIYKNTAAEIARHNRAMENRPVGGRSRSGAGAKGSVGEGGDPGTGAIQRMREINRLLEKGGGTITTNQGPLANIMDAAASSPYGQILGRATGTENQALRDEAASLRNNVLLDVKAATGLGTGSLNSNMELKTWLDSLGSMSMSVQARDNILNNIEEFIFRVDLAKQKNGGKLPPDIAAGESPPPLTPQEKAAFRAQSGGGAAAPSSGGTPVGTVKRFTSGQFRKVRPGPDKDRATWEAVQ